MNRSINQSINQPAINESIINQLLYRWKNITTLFANYLSPLRLELLVLMSRQFLILLQNAKRLSVKATLLCLGFCMVPTLESILQETTWDPIKSRHNFSKFRNGICDSRGQLLGHWGRCWHWGRLGRSLNLHPSTLHPSTFAFVWILKDLSLGKLS